MSNNVITLESQLEIVQQAKAFLLDLSEQNYQVIIKPHFVSSAGTHMRHILDHYLALQDGLTNGMVNYNKRNRQTEVENCPQTAALAWQNIEQWLTAISWLDADMPLTVVCETSIHKTRSTQSRSTLARELVFVASHAIHHFSLLAVMNSLSGNTNKHHFGVAASTASFLRNQS